MWFISFGSLRETHLYYAARCDFLDLWLFSAFSLDMCQEQWEGLYDNIVILWVRLNLCSERWRKCIVYSHISFFIWPTFWVLSNFLYVYSDFTTKNIANIIYKHSKEIKYFSLSLTYHLYVSCMQTGILN